MNKRKMVYRLFSVLLGLIVLYSFGFGSIAQDETPTEEDTVAVEVVAEEAAVLTAETVQTNLDQIWLLLAGFLVFFMQAGFAMLEGGFIRHTGVVNSLAGKLYGCLCYGYRLLHRGLWDCIWCL